MESDSQSNYNSGFRTRQYLSPSTTHLQRRTSSHTHTRPRGSNDNWETTLLPHLPLRLYDIYSISASVKLFGLSLQNIDGYAIDGCRTGTQCNLIDSSVRPLSEITIDTLCLHSNTLRLAISVSEGLVTVVNVQHLVTCTFI